MLGVSPTQLVRVTQMQCIYLEHGTVLRFSSGPLPCRVPGVPGVFPIQYVVAVHLSRVDLLSTTPICATDASFGAAAPASPTLLRLTFVSSPTLYAAGVVTSPTLYAATFVSSPTWGAARRYAADARLVADFVAADVVTSPTL